MGSRPRVNVAEIVLAAPAAVASTLALDRGILAVPCRSGDVLIYNTQTEGSVPPRKGNIPQPNPMTVRFAPTVAGKFKSEFLFKVRKGQSVVLAVSGEATLQEEHHAIIAKERHLRMMHAGTLM
mgnify:CR=1 FL=1